MKSFSNQKKIIKSLKELEEKNLNIGSEGNVSIRSEKGFYISPSAIHPDKLKISDIPYISFEGKQTGGKKPSSEWMMHLLIYKERSDIEAITHSHSMWSTSLSCLRKKIPSFHYMVAEFGGNDIKCSKYATFGTNLLAKNVLLALNERKGCLMANHGQLTTGKSIEESISLCESLEKLSKQYFLCKLTGQLKLLNKKEMKEVIDLFSNYKPKY